MDQNGFVSKASQELSAGKVRLVLGFLLACGVIFLILNAEGMTASKIFPLWLAWAALISGILVGFIFSASADEKKFSPVVTTINGVLGGALLTDLAKGGDSLVVKALRGASDLAQYGAHGEMLVASIIACFAGIGFLGAYLTVKVDINPLIADGDRKTGAAAQLGKILAEGDPTAGLNLSPDLKRVAEGVLSANLESAKPSGMLERGLAFLAEAEPRAAMNVLRMIPEDSALFSEAQTYLAYAYLNLEEYGQAAAILDRLVSRKGGVLLPFAWKLLGYAYLFLGTDNETVDAKRKRLTRSIQASRAALNINDTDSGLLLNLASAYGQAGPNDPEARIKLFEVLSKLFQIAPNMVERVKALTKDKEDFSEWKSDPQFQMALKNPSNYSLWVPPPTGSWETKPSSLEGS